MMIVPSRLLFFLLAPALFATSSAFAWGKQNHECIAEVAQQRLSPKAAATVQALVAEEPSQDLASIVFWADRHQVLS